MATSTWEELLGAADKEGGGEALPVGNYDVMVEAAEHKVAQSGNNMIVAVFNVVNGPHAGAKVYNNFVFIPENPKSLGFFFQHMAIFGVNRETLMAMPPPPESLVTVAGMIVGKYATITIAHRQWEGRTQNDVKKIVAYAAGVPVASAPAPAPAPAPVVSEAVSAAPGQLPEGPGSIQPPPAPPAPGPANPPTAPPF